MKYIEDYNLILKKILKLKNNNELSNASIEKTKSWDSVTHINLVSELENFFSIEFDTKEIIKFNSYKKGLEILKKKL